MNKANLSKHTLDCLSTCRSLVLCLASDEVYRDPLGNYRWGDVSNGELNPPGPLIGAHAVDLLHSLGVLPGQDWKDPETQEWLTASLGYKANGH